MGRAMPFKPRYPGTIPQCCLKSTGEVKMLYSTEEDARKVAKKFKGTWDIYPCRRDEGYHITKRRSR